MNITAKIIVTPLIFLITFIIIDCSMQKVAERKEGYTTSNRWAYYLYTDKEIRTAPESKRNTYFTFVAMDGSQPRESSIIYQDNDILPAIRNYLVALGYTLSEHDGHAEKWFKEGQTMPYFYLRVDKVAQTTTLTRVSYN